jgi:hypothetical protein
MPELSKQAIENLERIVDHYGLENLIRALAFICSEKSTHVAENWQDVKTAKVWMGYSVAIDGALSKIEDADAEVK